LRLAVAASFHPPRALRATEATIEARTGRRPGSGFAARTRRRFDDLEIERLVAAAHALEAPAIENQVPEAGAPMVLAPEAAAVLVDAYGRRCLGTRLAAPGGEGEPLPGGGTAAAVTLTDEPLLAEGAALPFDLDGVPKRRLELAREGRQLAAATDLDLAARSGRTCTGHGAASDEAWPLHLALAPGANPEAELRRRAAGGLRVGALEELAVELGAPFRFRAVARSLRRIGADGELGDALAPLVWSGDLKGCFAAVEATGDRVIAWAPEPIDGLGACRAPAVLLTGHGAFAPRALAS
jgi:predicted Zn-dependent protease